jgi:hypothetical protein
MSRRPAPVNTSSRRTGSVITIWSVSILSLTVKPDRRLADHNTIRKVGTGYRLRYTIRYSLHHTDITGNGQSLLSPAEGLAIQLEVRLNDAGV